MNNIFFTFIKPYLSYIDNGNFFRKPFSWLYAIFGILNLIAPFYILYKAFDVFTYMGGKEIFWFIIILLILIAAGWFSFQLWFDRMAKVANVSKDDDEYVATPVFAHFIQTFGEWFGSWLAVVGALLSLIMWISGSGSDIGRILPIGNVGITGLIVMPICGYLIIVVSRYMAEMMKALVAIAKNTKK